MSSKKLQEVFNFSEKDLKDNKAGLLSLKQEEFIRKYRAGTKKGRILSFVIIMISIAFIIIISPKSSDFKTLNFSNPNFIILLLITALFIIYLFFALLGFYKDKDVRNKKISIAKGKAIKKRKKIKGRGGFIGYQETVILDNIKFIIPYPEQYSAIEEGKYYNFFYIRTSGIHIILSVEEYS